MMRVKKIRGINVISELSNQRNKAIWHYLIPKIGFIDFS